MLNVTCERLHIQGRGGRGRGGAHRQDRPRQTACTVRAEALSAASWRSTSRRTRSRTASARRRCACSAVAAAARTASSRAAYSGCSCSTPWCAASGSRLACSQCASRMSAVPGRPFSEPPCCHSAQGYHPPRQSSAARPTISHPWHPTMIAASHGGPERRGPKKNSRQTRQPRAYIEYTDTYTY